MRRIIHVIKPPRKWRYPVYIILGIFLGLGAYSIYVSRAWSYVSDEPEVCINCHIMTPEFTTWRHSSHRENATCNDCHVPQDNVAKKYFFKGKDGLRHSTLFTLRAERQVIFIEEEGQHVVKANCIRCHEALFDQSKVKALTMGRFESHNTDRDCWECHRNTPHGRVHSLSSVPNTQVPLLESPVPEWLQDITEE